MRRWLVRVFFAVSVMITVAFVAPLAVLIRTTGEDRAIDAARADAAAVVPALVAGGTREQVASAVGATSSGAQSRMLVVSGDQVLAGTATESVRMTAALDTGESGIGDVAGGKEVVIAVSTGSGELIAIRVFVPTDTLRKGQWAAWGALALVAALLTSISVLIADRLARTVVRPTEELALAAKQLGEGDFGARVEPSGPEELVELGETFNELGDRISDILSRERELLAELSHRLRTPLTPLRMKIETIGDDALAADLRRDVDELTGIINDLIEEARRGARRSRTSHSDAASLVADRVEFWSVLAEDQGRNWSFVREADRAPVAVDADELSATVDVLLENVFAHTAEGVPLRVSVGVVDDFVHIGVADGGDGFDSYLVAAGRSGAGSTGLGLSIASRTAGRAGGAVAVNESDLGGALVEIVLPLALDV
jgi:signal transduction histidine kinase